MSSKGSFSIPFFLGMFLMAAAFVFVFVLTEPIRQSKAPMQGVCTAKKGGAA